MIADSWQTAQELFGYISPEKVLPPKNTRVFLPTVDWCLRHARNVRAVCPVPDRKNGESFECDAYSIRCVDRANDAVMKRKDLVGKCSHSIGVMDYAISSFKGSMYQNGISGQHVSNVVRCSDGVWYILEVLLVKMYPLFDVVRDRSISHVRFVWL